MLMARCPICSKEMQGQRNHEWPHYPFCSPRCRMIDLGRWLGEAYRVPVLGDEQEGELRGEADDLP